METRRQYAKAFRHTRQNHDAYELKTRAPGQRIIALHQGFIPGVMEGTTATSQQEVTAESACGTPVSGIQKAIWMSLGNHGAASVSWQGSHNHSPQHATSLSRQAGTSIP